jgi:hypothetical protein
MSPAASLPTRYDGIMDQLRKIHEILEDAVRFVDDIVPFRLRTRRELEVLARQTEMHKRFRAQLSARYSIEERVKDLPR